MAKMAVVKREVVSIMDAVEPVESTYVKNFLKTHTTTPPPCKKCQKERSRNSPKWKQKSRQKPTKANTPIVIQLKDSLKAALRQKQRSLAETVVKCKDVEVSVDNEVDSSQGRDNITTNAKQLKRKHDVKHLSALISVIEKSHKKDRYTNFTHSAQNTNSKLVANYVLNNASYGTDTKDSSRPRSIIECENVDVICNDLNSSEKSSVTTEDTESENGSTISSSEIQSDSDQSVSYENSENSKMSKDELEKLALFTTGCPLVRIDCPPSECPHCLSDMYNTQYYYNDVNSAFEFHKDQEGEEPSSTPLTMPTAVQDSEGEEVSVTSSTDSSDVSPAISPVQSKLSKNAQPFKSRNPKNNGQRSVRGRQLLDIDIVGRGGKSGQDLFPDSVYIDLTGTDVTFTVYYDQSWSMLDNSDSSSIIGQPHIVDNNYAISRNHSVSEWHPGVLGDPPSDSVDFSHMSVPHWYWPYVYPPLYSLTPPMYSAPLDANNVPKTQMIPPHQLRSFNSTQPPSREWVWLAHSERNRPTAIFTVMCYNVLCDKYCTRQLYGYCPSWALNWEYRKKGIMEEIKHCAADIICLQEVETDQFYNFFLPELKRDGYDGIFSAKSRARTMTESERKYVDGCAIFYRTSKFSLLKEHLVEFNQVAMANAEGSDDMLNRVMTKDNIGLAAMLETKEGVFENGAPPENLIRQQIMVATAHIHWDPEFCDVKLIQTMMLMWELKHVIEESIRSFRPGSSTPDINSIPLILCGDLNSLPDSGVLEFLNSGKVSRNHIDFKERGYDDCLQRINVSTEKDFLLHDFRLGRAYDNDIMPFTNYTFDFKGIIDYIFYSRDHLNLLGLLGPLDADWFQQNKVVGCPHPHVPSDHFPLLAEYEMPVPRADGSRKVNTSSTPVKNR
ncbi:uncharacterized protein LOC110451168 isoform X1 [Mizuhopecten yessoensis]|uniref:poly(A)-specific ribonuclease n=1 Tax=Mizuhopecten yessoensis TaxID=6573 RepID=A0A210QMB3_MIZYE|nr:uncharacterized protein LOC110451168 isoform X1 [Mizuhopecten yessoensis]OWF49841.1 CCR4-NOT transcription complex subunit 6-like [Mizuhopecten yessoensis]